MQLLVEQSHHLVVEVPQRYYIRILVAIKVIVIRQHRLVQHKRRRRRRRYYYLDKRHDISSSNTTTTTTSSNKTLGQQRFQSPRLLRSSQLDFRKIHPPLYCMMIPTCITRTPASVSTRQIRLHVRNASDVDANSAKVLDNYHLDGFVIRPAYAVRKRSLTMHPVCAVLRRSSTIAPKTMKWNVAAIVYPVRMIPVRVYHTKGRHDGAGWVPYQWPYHVYGATGRCEVALQYVQNVMKDIQGTAVDVSRPDRRAYSRQHQQPPIQLEQSHLVEAATVASIIILIIIIAIVVLLVAIIIITAVAVAVVELLFEHAILRLRRDCSIQVLNTKIQKTKSKTKKYSKKSFKKKCEIDKNYKILLLLKIIKKQNIFFFLSFDVIIII